MDDQSTVGGFASFYETSNFLPTEYGTAMVPRISVDVYVRDPKAGEQSKELGLSEIDVLYEEFALIVELDGRRSHDDLGHFRDMRRDNRSTSDGLATLRYGQRDVFGTPCPVAWQVGHNLMMRGWLGPLRRCAHCRNVPDADLVA